MEKFSFKMTLHPGMEAEYTKRHGEIWPELVDLLKAAGLECDIVGGGGTGSYYFESASGVKLTNW